MGWGYGHLKKTRYVRKIRNDTKEIENNASGRAILCCKRRLKIQSLFVSLCHLQLWWNHNALPSFKCKIQTCMLKQIQCDISSVSEYPRFAYQMLWRRNTRCDLACLPLTCDHAKEWFFTKIRVTTKPIPKGHDDKQSYFRLQSKKFHYGCEEGEIFWYLFVLKNPIKGEVRVCSLVNVSHSCHEGFSDAFLLVVFALQGEILILSLSGFGFIPRDKASERN